MKVNFITSQEGQREGYENMFVSPASVSSLPDGGCKAMVLDNVVEFMTEESFLLLLKKVRHGGVVEIRSPDALEVAKRMYHGRVTLSDASSLIAAGKNRLTTLSEVKSNLENNGLRVEFAALHDTQYVLKAARP
jgi:hypothetical protein